MTWVKICGMTNFEDALTAVDAGADAVGFVFYEKSPRNISVEAAREIVEKLPESVEKIGVFVTGSDLEPMRVLLERSCVERNAVVPVARIEWEEREPGVRWRCLASRSSARFLMALP
jgi:hypothetical protein